MLIKNHLVKSYGVFCALCNGFKVGLQKRATQPDIAF